MAVWFCIALASVTWAHMEMSWPYPFRSKFNPLSSYEDIDYSMMSPLASNGANFPCKGYQNDRRGQPTATYIVGSTYNVTLTGSATHHGGSCQISLSYDNGATFRVVKSMIGGCPLTSTFDFTIPLSAPSGDALLAWTWQNLEGNREFYMNCAQVTIISRISQRWRRKDYSGFEILPFLWKANLDGLNDCRTAEGEETVYPNPGPDVVYGEGLSSSSPPSPGSCDSSTPYGQTYKDLNDSSSYALSSASSNFATSPTESGQFSYASSYVGQESPSATSSKFRGDYSPISTAANKYNLHVKEPALLVPTMSTTTITITTDCSATVTVTLPLTRTPTTTPSHASRPSPEPTTPANPHPPFATGELDAFLPCVPGTFLCTSPSTWVTCNYNDRSIASSATWAYGFPRQVAAGMACLPFLSPYASGAAQDGQQNSVPPGSYRDDRMVRARPDGDCAINGMLLCMDGGRQFDVCDQGGWVRMGPVAAGTICRDGGIVAV